MNELPIERSTILIVDDDIYNRKLLEVILAGDNHRTFSVDSGHKALQIAETEEIDLVLLDIMMPGMAGFEVCRKLKEGELTREIPIIFISAKDDRESIFKGFELGAYDYFTKPVNQAEIQVKINNCLKLTQTEKRFRKEQQIRRKTEKAIQVIAEETAGTIGESFFERLVEKLGDILDVECALLGEWIDFETSDANVLACYKKNGNATDVQLDFAHPPFSEIREDRWVVFSKGVLQAFPNDPVVREFQAQSFIGAPLHGKEGNPLGFLVICGKSPISEPEHYESILRAFSLRASTELARLKMEDEVRLQKHRLDLAIDTSGAGVFEHSIPFGDGTFVSDHWGAILGFAPEDLPSWETLMEWFFSRIHPDDAAKLRKEYLGFMKGHIETYDREFRFLHSSGDYIWIEQNSQIVEWDDRGNPSRVVGVILDVTERREIQRKILNTIIETEEKERSRFAQDLHDGLGPLLSTAKLYIKTLDSIGDEEKKAYASAKSIEILDEAISSIKDIANNISPHIPKNFGLHLGHQELLKHMPEAGSLDVDLRVDLPPERPAENVELSAFRIVVEMIHKTLKHADASRASIHIRESGKKILIDYKDNGRGFDLEEILSQPAGMGMSNIVNWVKSLEGDIQFLARKGNGLFGPGRIRPARITNFRLLMDRA
ncbi:MAG: response regulator [Bacteroidales bacterium]